MNAHDSSDTLPPLPERAHALIVEDDPVFRQVMLDAIGAIGIDCGVAVFGTGESALAHIGSESPRPILVLVDLGLPDVSGIEVIRAAATAWPDVPVLVVSVLTSSRDVLTAIQGGAHGYLQKGDSALSLSESIRRVLHGEYPVSPSLARYLFNVITGNTPLAAAFNSDLLSSRETEFLRWLGRGYTYGEAAARMGVSLNTVKTFSKRIFAKLKAGSKGEALSAARTRGWLD